MVITHHSDHAGLFMIDQTAPEDDFTPADPAGYLIERDKFMKFIHPFL
ncbi:hypothetical protein SDC9_159724 [bioreactor metagenome]|uniref:Uncharacterized protein n=1 Tax=bioreactor metagenome TaxID=1076179 RepID=A0A645FFM8_9ZZZZ